MSDLSFRKATLDDTLDLLSWRNDSQTRANSIQSHTVSLQEHSNWLERSLKADDIILWICFFGDEKVGTLRENVNEENTTLSWTLSPDHRGRGLGKKMLVGFLKNRTGCFIAKIKEDNIPSLKIAHGLHMQERSRENGWVSFSLNLP